MPLKVSCAKCGGVLHAPDDAGGKKGKCPNCGNILPIPLDAQKVTDSMAGAGGLEGLPATTMVGNPVPRPAEPRGFGSTSALPSGGAGRVAAESRPHAGHGAAPPNPFRPPEPARQPSAPRPMPQAVPFGSTQPTGKKAWKRARRGLWWVRTGIVLFLISGVGTAVISAAGPLGIVIPEKDPGYLGFPRITFVGELLLGVGFVPVLLGLFAIVLGRFGVANAPAGSGARGPALWAAVFSLLAFAGLVAFSVFVGEQVRTGAAPRLEPTSEILTRNDWNTQTRVKEYLDQTIMKSIEVPGVVCRFALLAMIVFGALAETWFLGAIGRVGANLQDRRTCGRATTVCWLVSVLVAVIAFGWLAYGIFGGDDLKPAIDKWFNLALGIRTGIVAGIFGVLYLIGTFLYIRMLNAARAAIAARIG